MKGLAAIIMVIVIIPGMAHALYWEPGTGATHDTYVYTICDTTRQLCYDASLDFLTSVLHYNKPYWIVQAQMTIMAGFLQDMDYPNYIPERFIMTGDPIIDLELLEDSIPPGIPTQTYILLYDGTLKAPFIDQSRMFVGSLEDTILAINDFMDGPGIVKVGEMWGDVIVLEGNNDLYMVEYSGEGSAAFLIDITQPIPLAGIFKADRYDPFVDASMWFYSDRSHLDMLLGMQDESVIDISGPDNIMQAGTLSGLSWSSQTYRVESYSTTPGKAIIRGHSIEPGILDVVMPAFGSKYTFWQNGHPIETTYTVTGGVLSATIPHNDGDIIIHMIPNDTCTGDCLEDLILRAWDGPTALVYGSGFHGSIRMSLVSGDPHMVAPTVCPPGSTVTVDFDVMETRRPPLILPYVTTFESNLDVSLNRDGSTIRVIATGEPAILTLRMPAMMGNLIYTSNGTLLEPLAQSLYHDTITATLDHPGGTIQYMVESDGPSAWKSGLAIPSPVERTGVIWCGTSTPVNHGVIEQSGVNRQDCGVTKFVRGWNVWC